MCSAYEEQRAEEDLGVPVEGKSRQSQTASTRIDLKIDLVAGHAAPSGLCWESNMPQHPASYTESENPSISASLGTPPPLSVNDSSDLEMAGDCQTPSDWLAAAARSTDAEVLKAVARNPNTPKRELFRLWLRFPEAAAENPILTLWEFTSSDAVSSKIPKKMLLNLYQGFLMRPDLAIPEVLIPVDWRIYFLQCVDFQPRIPLHSFVRDTNLEVRLALLKKSFPHRFRESGPVPFPLESMELLLADAPLPILQAFARALAKKWIAVEEDSVEFLEKTARHLYSLNLESLLKHLSQWECLPPDLITDISMRGTPRILVNLTALPRCTHAHHEQLAGNEFPEVRAAVARFTRSTALQERLFGDPSPEVRAALASSQHIPDDMQRRFIVTRNAHIHQALLNNPRVLPEVLAYLAKLPYTGSKNRIFAHPNIPQDVFDEFMANGREHGVSQVHLAAKPERLTDDLYKRHKHHFEHCVLLAYASAPRTSAAILGELACHTSNEIQKAVSNLVSPSSREPSAISCGRAIAIIETVLNHPATTSEHPLLSSPRMSADQALRIFENSQFDPVLRFSSVLNRLKTLRNSGFFSEYADLYRKIAEPLSAMVPHLPLAALRPLTNHSETPVIIREFIRNTMDGNIRASNFVQSFTIPLSSIMEAFPEAFPSSGRPHLEATPHQILQKLATSPHFLVAHYADRCLSKSPEEWAMLVGRYPNG